MTKLDKIIATVEDQIKYGPSESAMVRILDMLEEVKAQAEPELVFDSLMDAFVPKGQELKPRKATYIEKTMAAMAALDADEDPLLASRYSEDDMWPHQEAPRDRAGNFTPGTPQFNSYVALKVNSYKDIKNIMRRYDLTFDEVLDAYSEGLASWK